MNAQPALDGPMHPCHYGCRAVSSLQLMLRDGDSASQLVYIAVSDSLALPRPRRLTDFPSMGRNELRKDAGGYREVPAGGRSSEDSRVTRSAHPSAGSSTHGHGDWMETDRCSVDDGDLLILRSA